MNTRRGLEWPPHRRSSHTVAGKCTTRSSSSSSRAGSLKHMNTAFLLSFLMESYVGCFHDFIVTPQIIQRSQCFLKQFAHPLIHLGRVLIATIKNLGKHPCPRCMIKLSDVPGMGKVSDSEKRADIRKRTKRLLQRVKMARKEIFKGYVVNGSRIEKSLDDGSRVAINVQYQKSPHPDCIAYCRFYRMHS